MLTFKDYRISQIAEAVKTADTGKVANLITSYLKKHLGGKIYLYPSIEQFKHGADVYTTVTIILSSIKFVRFNWLNGKLDQSALHSVTISDSGKHEEVTFDKHVSLVQILPEIVNILKKNVSNKSWDAYILDDAEHIAEEALFESSSSDPMSVVKSYFEKLNTGDKINLTRILEAGGPVALKIARHVIATNAAAFDGKIIVSKKIDYSHCQSILSNSKVKMRVSSDNTAESWVEPSGIDKQEVEEQISYIEKIEDLSNMLKFMLKGATNAVFVAGRGGTGKTQTVEDTLQEQGLSDGEGYFKVTGSASPAAIYETLYKNKKGVILFDDCDGALDTQDGRNLIKAATDTKNVRKVSWLKKSKAYYDPSLEGDHDEDGDDDIGERLPTYFDFAGKVVFISNLSMRKLDPDGALKTRGMMTELNPSNHEMYQFMELIYDKVRLSGTNELSKGKRKEVVLELRHIIADSPEGTVNLRLLVRALNLAATGLPDWQRMLKYA